MFRALGVDSMWRAHHAALERLLGPARRDPPTGDDDDGAPGFANDEEAPPPPPPSASTRRPDVAIHVRTRSRSFETTAAGGAQPDAELLDNFLSVVGTAATRRARRPSAAPLLLSCVCDGAGARTRADRAARERLAED